MQCRRLGWSGLILAALLVVGGTGARSEESAAGAGDVLETYATIAHALYHEAHKAAHDLANAVEALVASPRPESLARARSAWKSARPPYLQTEVYRFGNPLVDAWEGRVNAWPLDEGLIDYVATDSGSAGIAGPNVIANPNPVFGGRRIDAGAITPELLENALHELGGIEANVATGYHAIEFLLWGQDLSDAPLASGMRPYTDFDTPNCTGGHCQRRIAYLRAAMTLLIRDLGEMAAAWAPGGAARNDLFADGPRAGLARIIRGMGSLSYGELAGERIKLGLLLHDQEEEQDCFSDNTHMAHYFDQVGIMNVYFGRYRSGGETVPVGPGLGALVARTAPAVDAEMQAALSATLAAMARLVERARTVEHYDRMIAAGNPEGNAVVQAVVDRLLDQTRAIERVARALDLGPVAFEGSDSLDSPDAVFQ